MATLSISFLRSLTRILSNTRGIRLQTVLGSLSCPMCGCSNQVNEKFDNEIVRKKKQRPVGGGRFLADPSKVFQYNNWDNVVWDEEQEQTAREKVAHNSSQMVEADKCEKYEEEAANFWDSFYGQHQNRFFKDRHWLFTEFPELAPQGLPDHIPEKVSVSTNDDITANSASTVNNLILSEECDTKSANSDLPYGVPNSSSISTAQLLVNRSTEEKDCQRENISEESGNVYPGSNASMRIFEVGCGVGNTVFPVLATNKDPGLFVYCCDLSITAVELVKEHSEYASGRCHGFVCDVTDDSCTFPFPENSLDLIVLIFVLSAIQPSKMQSTINRLAQHLKPGGMILFRDYGRYDLAQLRFKPGKCLSENFYVRGDGTRVYFFTQEELKELFMKAGLVEQQNLIDRRLQVNRGKQLKMYRVWVQCKYKKPL